MIACASVVPTSMGCIGVDEKHQRGLRLRKVERDGLVAEDDAAVSDPAAGIEHAQTVEGGSLGRSSALWRRGAVAGSRGVSSAPVASARAQIRMSSSVEIMFPAAQAQDGFQSVAICSRPCRTVYPCGWGSGNAAVVGKLV